MIAGRIIKAEAVGGMAMLWFDFILTTIKICKKIIFTPKVIHLEKCEYCGKYFPSGVHSRRWFLTQPIYVCDNCAEKEVVCEECQERFLDDTEELGLDKILCRNCRDIRKNSLSDKMSDNKLVKTIMDAATLTGLAAGIGWTSKKVLKEDVTPPTPAPTS